MQKTQMLDFSAATAIQENAASELKRVEEGIECDLSPWRQGYRVSNVLLFNR